jgi:peroxiredoxin
MVMGDERTPLRAADLCRFLEGKPVCDGELLGSDGNAINLKSLGGLSVVFVHPGIGGPDSPRLLEQWTAIPGARGCTPEACSFRDELAAFGAVGAQVLGLSSLSVERQRDAVRQLHLPYPLLSDTQMLLAEQLGLPTFQFRGEQYYRRLTLIIDDGVLRAALYPVLPPAQGAQQALRWLSARQS